MSCDTASENPVCEEKLSSSRTEVLFVALVLSFLALFAWRIMAGSFGVIAAGLLFLFLFFCFYALNYRVLVIRILADKLVLKFGVIGWTIPLHTVEEVYADQTPLRLFMPWICMQLLPIRQGQKFRMTGLSIALTNWTF